MLPYLREHHADPGRLHAEGHATRVAVEDAREQVAARFGARPREVVFTATGTEAVNTAVFGALLAPPSGGGGGHVVTTAVEHSSVLDAVARGTDDVTVVGVDRHGRFDADEVAAAVRPDTVLVSVQLANHEVGTLQPAAEIVELRARAAQRRGRARRRVRGGRARARRLRRRSAPTSARSPGTRSADRRARPRCSCGAACASRRSSSAARRNGPGAPASRTCPPSSASAPRARRSPRPTGGEARASARCPTGSPTGALRRVDGVERYGDPDACLPHLVCLGVEGVEAEPILLALDQRGVAVHSGSSCSSESLEPSPVLAAMGVDADRSLRASVGWSSTDDDVDAFLDALPVVVGSAAGPSK